MRPPRYTPPLRHAFAALALLATPLVAEAQFAFDNAASYGSFGNGSVGGTGFGAWTVNTPNGPGGSGAFIGASTINGGGSAGIDTGSKSWGLYANSGNTSEAIRDFTTALGTGDTFKIRLDNGYIDNGGTVGMGLRNGSNGIMTQVYFIGGQSAYTLNDGTGITLLTTGNGCAADLAYTPDGIEVSVTQTSLTQYSVTVTRFAGGSCTLTGRTYANSGPASRIRVFNANAGSGDNYNFYANSLRIQRAATQDVTVTATGAAGFRQFAPPVAGQTVASFASQNLVQGVSDEYPSAAKNFYTGYNGDNSANSGGTGQFGFTVPASKAEVVAPGQGVNWYLFNSAFGPLSGGTSQSYTLPRTHTFTGIAQAGNVTYAPPVRALGDGFYLVGNPYAAPFFVGSGSTLTSTSGTIGTNFDVFDKTAGSYVNLATVNSGVAAIGQGFFVQMTGAAPGTFTFNANGLRSTSPTFYRKGGAEGGDLTYLGLALTGMTSTGMATNDIASALRFEADASDGWDRHDGSKISPPLSAYATVAFMGAGPDGQVEEKSNESRVGVGAGLTLPLRITATHGGTYTLAVDASNFPSGARIEVLDAVSGTRTDLRTGTHTFTLAAAGASDRLSLVVSPGTTTAAEGASAVQFEVSDAMPNPARDAVRLRVTAASAAAMTVEVYDVLGRRVQALALDGMAAGQELTVTLDVAALPAGTYLVRVGGADGAVTRRLTVIH